jgi:hypothetical protein
MVRAAAVEYGLAGPKYASAAGAGLIINECVFVMICSDSLLALAFSRGSEAHERAPSRVPAHRAMQFRRDRSSIIVRMSSERCRQSLASPYNTNPEIIVHVRRAASMSYISILLYRRTHMMSP